jgi:hypothetical protein
LVNSDRSEGVNASAGAAGSGMTKPLCRRLAY